VDFLGKESFLYSLRADFRSGQGADLKKTLTPKGADLNTPALLPEARAAERHRGNMKRPGRPVSNPAMTIDARQSDAVWLSRGGRRPTISSSRHHHHRSRRIGNRDNRDNRGSHGNRDSRRIRALPEYGFQLLPCRKDGTSPG